MIRVCPKRDAACPHGMLCPFSLSQYDCMDEPPPKTSPIDWKAPETIVAAAHLYDPRVWSPDPRALPVIVSAPPPARHHNLFALPDKKWRYKSGFLTSTGRFVGREEARRIALASGQPMIDHPSRHDRLLFSEDLW